MTRIFTVDPHEGYQARAFQDDPRAVGLSTERSLRSVARAAKREAERPRPSMWDKLGPFCNISQVATRLGVSEGEVLERATAHEVVAMCTTDGVWVFPLFQFDPPQLQPKLVALFAILMSTGVDDWTAAGWLKARHAELDSKTPVEWLLSDADTEPVMRLAREAALRFSR